jgi:hypothetical protein
MTGIETSIAFFLALSRLERIAAELKPAHSLIFVVACASSPSR